MFVEPDRLTWCQAEVDATHLGIVAEVIEQHAGLAGGVLDDQQVAAWIAVLHLLRDVVRCNRAGDGCRLE